MAQARLVPNYRLSAATRQVVTDLRMLRAKAIAQNSSFRMVFAANSNEYHAERLTPPSTWNQYALYKHGTTTEGSTVGVGMPSTVVTTAAVTVTFEPRGLVTTTGTITLRVPGPRTRQVSINSAGLMTIS